MNVREDDGGYDIPSDWNDVPLSTWSDSLSKLVARFGDQWESQLVASGDFVLAGYALRKNLKYRASQMMFESAIQIDPNNIEALEGYIDIVRTQGYRDAVIMTLSQWSSSYSNRADVQLLIGKTYRRLSLNNDALEAFRRCVKLEPDLVDAHYFAGLQLERLLRFREAALAFTRVIEIQPQYANAWFHLARCRLRVDVDLAQAQIALRYAEQLGRHDWFMTLLGCEILLREGSVSQAMRRFDKYVEENNTKSYFFHTFANRLLDFGFKEEALHYFSQPSAGWRAKGGALEDLGRLEDAEAQFKLIVDANPQKASAWTDLAKFYARHGFAQQAIDACRQALALREDAPRACRLLGELLYGQGEIQEARKLYAGLLKQFPMDTSAKESMGFILLDLGKSDEAQRLLSGSKRPQGSIHQKVPELRARLGHDQQNSEAPHALGQALLKRGFPCAAMIYLQEASRRAPLDPKVNLAIGEAYIAYSGNQLFRLAATYFSKALQVHESLIHAHLGLVHCYRAMHRYPEQRYHESRALEIDPNVDLTNRFWWFVRD